MGRGLRSRRGSVVLGLLAIGGALVVAVIPNTERYSTDGFGLFGRAQVKCGSAFDSKVEVSFDDYSESVSYRSDVNSYGEPTIFEGKTATQVCRKADKDARTTALWVGGIGVVLFFVGLNRLSKANRAPSFAVAGAGPMSSAPSLPALKVSTPKATSTPAAVKPDNPARWTEDPFGRFELRFWDGRRWSEHVSTGGRQDIDPPKPTPVPAKQAFAPPSFDHDGHTIPRTARPTLPTLVLMMSTGARS